MIRRLLTATCLAALASSAPLFVRALAQDAPRLDPSNVEALKWRSIGPGQHRRASGRFRGRPRARRP